MKSDCLQKITLPGENWRLLSVLIAGLCTTRCQHGAAALMQLADLLLYEAIPA